MPYSPLSRVYMIAFACEPGRGSEPGVGFAFAKALAIHARRTGRPATLVTRPHTAPALKQALEFEDLDGHLEILVVKLPIWLIAMTRREHVRYAYIWWQVSAVRFLRTLLDRRREPAIIHHVTFATEALPAFEWRVRARVARVFGPAGSAEIGRKGSGERVGLKQRLRATIARLNLRGVDLIVAQNRHVGSAWEALASRHVVEPNVALGGEIHLPRDAYAARSDTKPRTRLVSLGRLIPLKRHELAIQVLQKLPQEYTLTIIGDGPLQEDLEVLAAELGVRDRVAFTGGLSREEALICVADHDLLLHCSRREGAGWAVGEAQAIGVIPVVFAGSGAEDVVSMGGLGVAVATVDDMVASIQRLRDVSAEPSDRWLASRLPDSLETWYGMVDDTAAMRSAVPEGDH